MAMASSTGALTTQGDRRQRAVEGVLERELPAAGVDRVQGQQRNSADVVQSGALVDRLIEAGNQGDADAEGLALPDLLDQHVITFAGEGENDVARAGVGDRHRQVVGAAEHRQSFSGGAGEDGQGVGVEEADRIAGHSSAR